MEKFQYTLSQKNIPIPSQTAYRKQLIAKTEDFIQRIRWKTFFYLNPDAKRTQKETFGFKTSKTAPQAKELTMFENDLAELISSKITFNNIRKPLQAELAKYAEEISKNEKLLINADKTSSIYQVSVSDYKKLLKCNITKDYKIAPPETYVKINAEATRIAQDLELADRIECYSNAPAFVTLKDHKENFENNPKCRLINPAKTNIGKISKQILQKINTEVRKTADLTQWQSTGEVLNWFRKIQNKEEKRFLQLDIVEFYPSINENLLDKALKYASDNMKEPINARDIRIIKHSRQALLFTRNEDGTKSTWTKKNGTFDVTMGAPDGAEVCELVGLFLIKEVRTKFPKLNFGLYRDDGLAVHQKESGREVESTRQQLHTLFQQHGLKITVDPPNKTTVNFLDVTLNLEKGTFCPYRKPNDQPLYVHSQSNHPPNVIKTIPISINKRLSNISSNKDEFDKAKREYQEALDASGYKHKLTYEEPTEATSRKKRTRNILWFTPPYNQAVTTNLGACFLKLLEKHFPKGNPLHPILNRNTVKLSYSCTKNIKRTIQAHNTKLLNTQEEKADGKTCNCQKSKKDKCPLKGQCLQKNVIYQATVKSDQEEKKYIGCASEFKTRYYSHTSSFRNEGLKNATALASYVWEKQLGPNPDIKWEILDKAPAYSLGSRNCDLCLTEKLHIARNIKSPQHLNKRGELAQRCRHRHSFLLIPPSKRGGDG